MSELEWIAQQLLMLEQQIKQLRQALGQKFESASNNGTGRFSSTLSIGWTEQGW